MGEQESISAELERHPPRTLNAWQHVGVMRFIGKVGKLTETEPTLMRDKRLLRIALATMLYQLDMEEEEKEGNRP